MADSITRPRSLDYSATPLRSETARLLHAAGSRVAKMIAAALSVGRSRVDRMHAGEDANYLELLARELDRIEIEEGVERVLPVVRWLAARYGHGIHERREQPPTTAEIERQIGQSIRETSEAHAAALEAAPGGFDERERAHVTQQIDEGIERLQALRQTVTTEVRTH